MNTVFVEKAKICQLIQYCKQFIWSLCSNILSFSTDIVMWLVFDLCTNCAIILFIIPFHKLRFKGKNESNEY